MSLTCWVLPPSRHVTSILRIARDNITTSLGEIELGECLEEGPEGAGSGGKLPWSGSRQGY